MARSHGAARPDACGLALARLLCLLQANVADGHVDSAVAALQQLPPYYRDFYKARAASRLAAC